MVATVGGQKGENDGEKRVRAWDGGVHAWGGKSHPQEEGREKVRREKKGRGGEDIGAARE